MALSITWGPQGKFDVSTRDSASRTKRIAFAALKDATTVQRITAENDLTRGADFRVQVATTDNTAASTVLDLTALGVTFPSNLTRLIRFRSVARSDTDLFIQDWEQYVLGGTTPKLLGSPRLINALGHVAGTASQWGYCEFHGTTSGATVSAVSGVNSAGISCGNFSSGVATLTVPSYRTGSSVLSTAFSEDAGTVADTRLIQVRPATATTFTINTFDVQNASPAISSPNGNNTFDIRLYLLPPPTVALALATNNVVVQAGFNATDNLDHFVEAFIGRTEIAQPSAT